MPVKAYAMQLHGHIHFELPAFQCIGIREEVIVHGRLYNALCVRVTSFGKTFFLCQSSSIRDPLYLSLV